MTKKSQTSRSGLLDAIELCINLIASSSHTHEMIHTDGVEYKYEEDDLKQAELAKKIEEHEKLIKMQVSLRRDVMSYLSKDYEIDKKYWCSFKHAIAAVGFAQEVYHANPSIETHRIMFKATELMYMVASKFL